MPPELYPPFALVIAGSDPSGGAGLQADMRTFTSLGVDASAAITCVTVQDSTEVREIVPMAGTFVAGQIHAAFNDLAITHVKIGMLGTEQIARAVTDSLKSFTGEIVYDPVLTASSGGSLVNAEQDTLYIKTFLQQVTMLTPNRQELEILSNRKCRTQETVTAAAKDLFTQLPRLRCLVVTGGHFNEEHTQVIDTLFTRSENGNLHQSTSSHPRVDTGNCRGTGCTFASALTAFHLLGQDDLQAFSLASDYVSRLLSESSTWKTKGTTGPMCHASLVPRNL